MTAPDRNARVTERNDRDRMKRRIGLRLLAESYEGDFRFAVEEIDRLDAALAAMTAERDRWRALAENTHPGKGRA